MSAERLAELQELLTDWRGDNIRLRKETEGLRAQFAAAQAELERLKKIVEIERNKLRTAERRAWNNRERMEAAERSRDKLQAHLTKSVDEHEAACAEIAERERLRTYLEEIIAIKGFVVEQSGGKMMAAFTWEARDIARRALAVLDMLRAKSVKVAT